MVGNLCRCWCNATGSMECIEDLEDRYLHFVKVSEQTERYTSFCIIAFLNYDMGFNDFNLNLVTVERASIEHTMTINKNYVTFIKGIFW